MTDLRTERSRWAAFFALQAFAIVVWWSALALWPDVRNWFWPGALRRETLDAFLLPDLALAMLCAATAFSYGRGRRLHHVGAGAVAAAFGYAGLYCLGIALHTGDGWLGSALMLTAAGLNVAVCLR